MRLYLFTPLIAPAELNQNYKLIAETLRNAGIFVVASNNENNNDFKKEELERLNETGETLLDKMDCIVIEGSQQDQEIGYLLAYAISLRKPLLYLVRKGTPEKIAHGYLTKKNTPEYIHIVQYSAKELAQVVIDFIEQVSSGKGFSQKPTIKFTLRITPRMERYLTAKAKQRKLTKADFLRKFLEEIMEKDEGFKGK
ncbi:MAG: hypothetical protein PHY34_02400 [Patescibacteria group bacterium]|nr:hypothetical protein [Patescibacteria group bacterium]MDD5715212.1 hypothetical protein [Patescibacteria group bacterium]